VAILIAHVSSGKGTWSQASNLIALGEWSKVFLICNEFAYKNFDVEPSKGLKLQIDENNPQDTFEKLSAVFKKQLSQEFEVAINQTSGSGFEHMAVMSAVLKAGVGIRFVYVEEKELKEFKLLDHTFSSDENDSDFF
jgi:hypothetical protein